MKKEDFYVIINNLELDRLPLKLFKNYENACNELRQRVLNIENILSLDLKFENLGWSNNNDAFHYSYDGIYRTIKVDKITVMIEEETNETQRTY